MSKIFVDQVDPKTGTSLTLGTSGDTVNIPSGVTLANAGTVTGLPASAISSGTIATARLGSGTASSSTFLRGDQTYATAGMSNLAPYFHANDSTTSISNNVGVAVVYSNEVWDSNSLYDPSTGRFTVTAATTGYYYVYAAVKFNNLTANRIQLRIMYNNGGNVNFALTEQQSDASGYPCPHVSCVIPLLTTGHYAFMEAYQNSGGTIGLSNETEGNYFGGFKIA